VLTQKSDFDLLNATLAHARSTIAEDLDYLRACLKANRFLNDIF